jgi:histidyl-tRNA synthetase
MSRARYAKPQHISQSITAVMPPTKVERVLGAHDVSPREYAYGQQVTHKLQQCFRSFGYQPIELPIVEHDELYLLKSGEEVIAKMYEFVHQNSHLCLRPEMTASVARAYVDDRLVDDRQNPISLPARFQYSGAVFQSDRQFTQVGIELIGAAGTMADAEVIAATCRCLEDLAVANFQLTLSHMGILTQFLAGLGLEERLRSMLLGNMAKMRSAAGQARLRQLLTEFYPNFEQPEAESQLWRLFAGQAPEQAKATILELLDSLNIELTGNRSESEIADRLLTKIQRRDGTKEIDRALEFMAKLSAIHGDQATVLPQIQSLLTEYQCDSQALEDLKEILGWLTAYGVDAGKITIDLGMDKDFQYYTGIVFEVGHPALGEQGTLCGGGRYDDLVANLGGHTTPATGCSFDLDLLLLALKQENKFVPVVATPAVLVLCGDSPAYGIQVADSLRRSGITVELNQDTTPAHAWVIRVSATEQSSQTIRLQNHRGQEQVVSLTAAIAQIQQ